MKTEQITNKITLIHGDCMEYMPSHRDGCVVTDPPFNVGYHYKSYKDNRDENEYYEWLADVLGGGTSQPCVVVHYPESLYKLSFQLGVFPERVISWVYNSNTPRQHRDIAYFGVKPDFNQVVQPYKNPTDKRIAERISRGILGGKMYDWFEVNQVKNVSKKKDGVTHPCQMPLEVMKKVVGVLPTAYKIVDPFMGSGTTAIAAYDLGFEFVGIEIDDEYYETAKARLLRHIASQQPTLF